MPSLTTRPFASRTRSTVLVLALAGGGALTLAGCSSEDEPEATSVSPSASGSASPSSTVSVPSGVTLTEPGSTLGFGDPADVAFEPGQKRGTTLELTVKKARKGAVKDLSGFVLDKRAKKASYYYVNVSVQNTGEGDVGGAAVPLWGVDGKNILLPAVDFTTDFARCQTKKLPKKFEQGDSISTCLVFLAPDHGSLEAVSYRPTEEFDPIQWTGKIAR